MDLARLRVFAAVVEEGSFTRAASSLYMTQSGVSRAVASLESELGLPLLVRAWSGVQVTDAGRRVLEHTYKVLSEVELLNQEVAAMSGLEVGRLRIGGFPSACARLLPGIVGEFERRYSGIDVILSEGTDHDVTEWLHQHMLDVGFVHLPATGLHTVPIAGDKMLLTLPPDHRLAGTATSVNIRELADEPFILPRGRSEPIVASIFREADIAPTIRFTLRDVSTILSMVREGMGISILAEMSLLPIMSGICTRPIEPTAERQIGLATLSKETALPATRAFIKLARTWTEANGYLP